MSAALRFVSGACRAPTRLQAPTLDRAMGYVDRMTEPHDTGTAAEGASATPGISDAVEEPAVTISRQEALALIAHELRAPLTVIKGYIGILERPMDEDSRAAALAATGRAAARLDTMLDDLLAASGDSRVFAPRHTKPTSMRALAQDVADELTPLHDHLIEILGDDSIVDCDPNLIRQVLCNLIGNALKHTPEDGHVSVTVSDSPAETILLVEDDGPGVSESERERVFELFTRLGTPAEMPPGLGLGLPVSRSIVEQHGGTLVLTDTCRDTGACFEMRLPRR